MDVAPERDELLVIRESYDPGWRALVDGEERAIVRADYLFMGVPLHAGERNVVLVFAPRSVRVGVALSAGALLALSVVALGRGRVGARSI